MLVQEMVIDNDTLELGDTITLFSHHHSTPIPKSSRSDVHFPLSTPRRRAPSVASIADIVEQQHDGHSIGKLTIRARDSPIMEAEIMGACSNRMDLEDRQDEISQWQDEVQPQKSFHDLPLEVQGKILDFIFGDMHSVNAGSTSLRGKSVSSLMRHPRRKAVSDLALVSATWREMVQERIYRHIKIKGTRAGLAESEDYFCQHMHLTKHVRHIEFWVPVWGDKASIMEGQALENLRHLPRSQYLANQINESFMTANDPLGFNYKLSIYSATLSELFAHISVFFTSARVFTLEGGHCKKSNMIRHFPDMLFSDMLLSPTQALDKLPEIRTFAMRGAWNIMRQYSDWKNIQAALPNLEEWHCGYAKPRMEAEATINDILLRLPIRVRHLNISLDGMYSKDPTTLGSSSLPVNHPQHAHLCERLGAILPQLESLSFTGKICECLWSSALNSLTRSKPSTSSSSHRREDPPLHSLELVVKSCCRQRITTVDPDTGETVVDELGGVMADGAGITNLTFIRAFERLILNTVDALRFFTNLQHIRIRFIDLDSPCTLLNPYWLMEKSGRVYGIWNEEIVERLSEVKPDASIGYVELGDGIEILGSPRKSDDWEHIHAHSHGWQGHGHGHAHAHNHAHAHGHGHGNTTYSTHGTPHSAHGQTGNGSTAPPGGVASMYPRVKPRSIKTSSYRILAETRGT